VSVVWIIGRALKALLRLGEDDDGSVVARTVGQLPEPPTPPLADRGDAVGWGGRAFVRFVLVHLSFVGACLGVSVLTNWLIHPDTVYEIGAGKEFPTLEAAREAVDLEVAWIWVSVGAFSSLIVLTVWIWKRAFAWFWIPLAFLPFIGQVFCAIPATWVLANGSIRIRAAEGSGSEVVAE
jgi:hypothetical protein